MGSIPTRSPLRSTPSLSAASLYSARLPGQWTARTSSVLRRCSCVSYAQIRRLNRRLAGLALLATVWERFACLAGNISISALPTFALIPVLIDKEGFQWSPWNPCKILFSCHRHSERRPSRHPNKARLTFQSVFLTAATRLLKSGQTRQANPSATGSESKGRRFVWRSG